MNLTDLTEVLRDHAENLDDTAHEARMAGVRARILATRRRLALTGVVCVVLALVGVVYVALPREVESARPPRSLPEYQDGARLVTQSWADLPTASVTVKYTPKAEDFVIFRHCSTEPSEPDLVTMLLINGKEASADGCGHDSTVEIDVARYGGVVGEPLVIRMVVGVSGTEDRFPEKVEHVRPPEGTTTGEFAVGVGEPVPVSEYPFPPRPETLEDVDEFVLSGETVLEIRSDRNDPDARQTVNVTWPGPLRMITAVNTPGRLEVLINGKVVYDMDSWDYRGRSGYMEFWEGDGLNIPRGQTATITVIPERTTGDWKVEFAEEN